MSRKTKVSGFAYFCIVAVSISACATKPVIKNYTAFRSKRPRSILVLPIVNKTKNAAATDYLFSTINRPFAERGYYVFPANVVQQALQKEGLSDPSFVRAADPKILDKLFGCDTELLVDITQWDSKYFVVSTTTTVSFNYALKSCKTGETIWENKQTIAHSSNSYSSGSALAGVVSMVIAAGLEKGAPNYMALTVRANGLAASAKGRGLPAGPYLENSKKILKLTPIRLKGCFIAKLANFCNTFEKY